MASRSGFPVGYPLDSNRETAAQKRYIPPKTQTLHLCLAGRSGSGKSTLFETALYHNQRTTDGADIVFDSKGDGLPEEYQQIHYACEGSLAGVYHFDLEACVPAISFFDVRPLVADGVPRESAVDRIADHYLSLARHAYGAEAFDRSTRAATMLKLFVKALFDPIHGDDCFRHQALREAATAFKRENEIPPTSEAYLADQLEKYAEAPDEMRHNIADAVLDRISAVTETPQLRRMLNHTFPPRTDLTTDDADTEGNEQNNETNTTTADVEPALSDGAATTTAAGPTPPRFDLRELLDEDVVIIFDTSGLGETTVKSVTLLLLSNLWRACTQRKRAATTTSLPLANIYLEEAGVFAGTRLLAELLPLARSFDVGFVLIPQYPGQLVDSGLFDETSAGPLNNIGAVITGNVPDDPAIVEYFSGAHATRREVEQWVDGLARGEWLVRHAVEFGDQSPPPFITKSPPLPPGHPEGPYPLADSRLEDAFETARESRRATVHERAAHPIETDDTGTPTTQSPATLADDAAIRLHNLLPRTNRLPECVTYEGERHRLACTTCETTYPPTLDGIFETIRCCHDLGDVDRADIPVVKCHHNLTPEEFEQLALTPGQVCFMQAVHDATHLRHDPRAFDLVTDSMVRLREYAGVGTDGVATLRERGLLTRDARNTPHRVYSLTDAGRDCLNIDQISGRDYGAGVGDLNESALHRLAVEVGRRYIHEEYVTDPESPVTEAVGYPAVEGADGTDGHRLDAAGLTADGSVHVALEAERANNDLKTAAPADFDTMAACDPAEAIWVVMNRDGAHAVLEALNDPADGEPRVEKTYGNTPPRQFAIDTSGCTAMYTVSHLRSRLESTVTRDS